MRVEQVYRQSLQMAQFVANRCRIPSWSAIISRDLLYTPRALAYKRWDT
jgi:hypothetical protein